MKRIFFLAGLPRSGSTLLGSILSQHHEIHVTPTSPMLDWLCFMNNAISKSKTCYTYDYDIDNKLYRNIAHTYFNHFDKPIVIDKHRGWPRNIMPAQMCITDHPKVVCTYRPISEIITSYLKLMEQSSNNFVDNDLKKLNRPLTTENRADHLWTSYINDPYSSLTYGIENHRKNLLMINYNELMSNPEATLDSVYDFLGIVPFDHDFNNIANACGEDKDAAWGLAELHNIRPKLGRISTDPNIVLGPFLTHKYNQYNIKF